MKATCEEWGAALPGATESHHVTVIGRVTVRVTSTTESGTITFTSSVTVLRRTECVTVPGTSESNLVTVIGCVIVTALSNTSLPTLQSLNTPLLTQIISRCNIWLDLLLLQKSTKPAQNTMPALVKKRRSCSLAPSSWANSAAILLYTLLYR